VLRVVGMEDRLTAFPPSLSGGEQQRVAVARAVAGDPKIILADEPTGSLDDESAAIIFKLLNMIYTAAGRRWWWRPMTNRSSQMQPAVCFISARVEWTRRRISEMNRAV
jgi:ABC-type iron transport system FetAB ATPase subunit